MKKFILLSALLSVSISVPAADFSGTAYKLESAPISIGSLLECHELAPQRLETHSPKVFNWAKAAGLIERSAISGVTGYSAKVSSRSGGERALIVGCWVARKIVTEQINGVEHAYAQGVYEINDALTATPVMDLAVCRKKRNQPGFTQGDYQLLDEVGTESCVTNQWQERMSSLRALRGHTQLFQASKLHNRPGYGREISF